MRGNDVSDVRAAGTNSSLLEQRSMKGAATPLLLLLAAVLEVGGDAIVRVGLKNYHGVLQISLIALGGIVLLAYGVFVNVAPADFGRLLGVYVVLFFVVAQIVNFAAFGIRPDAPIIVGGGFILAGGLVLTVWKT
jgi:small multidrug resistance family-3 protein